MRPMRIGQAASCPRNLLRCHTLARKHVGPKGGLFIVGNHAMRAPHPANGVHCALSRGWSFLGSVPTPQDMQTQNLNIPS